MNKYMEIYRAVRDWVVRWCSQFAADLKEEVVDLKHELELLHNRYVNRADEIASLRNKVAVRDRRVADLESQAESNLLRISDLQLQVEMLQRGTKVLIGEVNACQSDLKGYVEKVQRIRSLVDEPVGMRSDSNENSSVPGGRDCVDGDGDAGGNAAG